MDNRSAKQAQAVLSNHALIASVLRATLVSGCALARMALGTQAATLRPLALRKSLLALIFVSDNPASIYVKGGEPHLGFDVRQVPSSVFASLATVAQYEFSSEIHYLLIVIENLKAVECQMTTQCRCQRGVRKKDSPSATVWFGRCDQRLIYSGHISEHR
jgi:hypothetical protein